MIVDLAQLLEKALILQHILLLISPRTIKLFQFCHLDWNIDHPTRLLNQCLNFPVHAPPLRFGGSVEQLVSFLDEQCLHLQVVF